MSREAAMLHSIDIRIPVSAIFHPSPLIFPFFSSPSLCLIVLLFTCRSWPLLALPGSQALKPSQGCKSVSPSQEISWGSVDSTKPGQWEGPNVTHKHTQSLLGFNLCKVSLDIVYYGSF